MRDRLGEVFRVRAREKWQLLKQSNLRLDVHAKIIFKVLQNLLSIYRQVTSKYTVDFRSLWMSKRTSTSTETSCLFLSQTHTHSAQPVLNLPISHNVIITLIWKVKRRSTESGSGRKEAPGCENLISLTHPQWMLPSSILHGPVLLAPIQSPALNLSGIKLHKASRPLRDHLVRVFQTWCQL